MRKAIGVRLGALLGALLLAGCQRDGAAPASPAAAAPAVKFGLYRVVLHTPGGELPFGMSLEREAGRPVAYLLNGPERLKVSEVTIDGAHLEILMPGYENRLSATATGDALKGEIALSKLHADDQHVPLDATLGPAYRFFDSAAGGAADVSGRWAITFTDGHGATEQDVGEFTQSQDTVSGTILTPTGDHRYLAGQVRGDELDLSTFDGAHVFLYRAHVGADGRLQGDWWSGLKWHETFTARRDATAALRDPYRFTTLKPGEKKFEFAFPDLDGHTVSSGDAKFKGKVMIVALAGSWCPNCHDEAAFLEPLYQEYRARGLEVVSLQFEHFGDFPHAAAATQRFRQHYGIDYTTLIAGISDKDDAAQKLPALSKVEAFPTTLFIDRKGNVREIHTGFTGPATGEHYAQFVEQTRAQLDRLLAEG